MFLASRDFKTKQKLVLAPYLGLTRETALIAFSSTVKSTYKNSTDNSNAKHHLTLQRAPERLFTPVEHMPQKQRSDFGAPCNGHHEATEMFKLQLRLLQHNVVQSLLETDHLRNYS